MIVGPQLTVGTCTITRAVRQGIELRKLGSKLLAWGKGCRTRAPEYKPTATILAEGRFQLFPAKIDKQQLTNATQPGTAVVCCSAKTSIGSTLRPCIILSICPSIPPPSRIQVQCQIPGCQPLAVACHIEGALGSLYRRILRTYWTENSNSR
ncbi:hypothetical protein N658DRAFT_218372 [Parathielavia hyrcaniae]|uniref:Uncharacterized protein n=1 Tax=Parathielavia hyrcaniae TaxID=113614 RepID=A0AAN6PVB3_9PEZI|nr:hypothetical protein N658DRAFT_218372 [Parathielavia hyrcaniae]